MLGRFTRAIPPTFTLLICCVQRENSQILKRFVPDGPGLLLMLFRAESP
jgi:hypothetical protein